MNSHVCAYVYACMQPRLSCARLETVVKDWTLFSSMDCSPPGSCVHGISQARILEWGAIPFSRGILQDCPNLGFKTGSPALQADSLLSQTPGKPSLVKTRRKMNAREDFFFNTLIQLVLVKGLWWPGIHSCGPCEGTQPRSYLQDS